MGLWSDVMKILSLWTSTKKYTTPIWPWGKRQIPVEGQLENTWLVPPTTLKVTEDRGSPRNRSSPEEPPETRTRGILDGILGQKKVYGNFNAVWTLVNNSVSTLLINCNKRSSPRVLIKGNWVWGAQKLSAPAAPCFCFTTSLFLKINEIWKFRNVQWKLS